ncbi:MAG: hypothetical protein R6V83_14350 [Candidatus Thorarchaeota archaeon]
MERDEHIIEAAKWRQYDLLNQLVEREISEWGWLSIKKIFLVRENKISLPRIRDAVLHLLGLDSVRGIDTGYETLLRNRDVGGESLAKVRESAHDIANEILSDMIENRNTYLLDIDAMSIGPFAVLIPDILDARRAEILDLPSHCTVSNMVETAYGYSVLTTCGSLTSSRQEGFQRMRTAMNEIAEEMDTEITISSSPLQLGNRISGFENCSRCTRDVLWHILRMMTYRGKQAVRKSAKFVRDHADSRFLPWLHRYLSDAKLYYTAVKIMKALGNIGHPSSADYLLPFTRRRGNWGRSSINALANLSGNDTAKLLIKTVNTRYHRIYRLYRLLSNRPPEEVLPLLEQLDDDSNGYSNRLINRLKTRKQKELHEREAALASRERN